MRRNVYLHPSEVSGKEKPGFPKEGLKETLRRQLDSPDPFEQLKGLAVLFPKLSTEEKKRQTEEMILEILAEQWEPGYSDKSKEVLKSLDLKILEEMLKRHLHTKEVVIELYERGALKNILADLKNIDTDLLIGLAGGLHNIRLSIDSIIIAEDAVAKGQAETEVRLLNSALKELPNDTKSDRISKALTAKGISAIVVDILNDAIREAESVWGNKTGTSNDVSSSSLTLEDLKEKADIPIGCYKIYGLELLTDVDEERKIMVLKQCIEIKKMKEFEIWNKEALRAVLNEVGERGTEYLKRLVFIRKFPVSSLSPLTYSYCEEAGELLAARFDKLKSSGDIKALSLIARSPIPSAEREKLKKSDLPVSKAEWLGVPVKDGVDEPLTEYQVEKLRTLIKSSECPVLERVIKAVDALAEMDGGKEALTELIKRGERIHGFDLPCETDESMVTNLTVRKYILAEGLKVTTEAQRKQEERERKINEILDAI